MRHTLIPGANFATRNIIPASGNGLLTGLVSYWKLDENAADTTVEDSHAANDGQSSTNTSNLSAAGKIGNAFDFTAASTEFVDFDDINDLDFGSTAFSINFWIYPHALNSNYSFLNKGLWNTSGWYLGTENTGFLDFVWYDTAARRVQTTAGDIGTGAWYMVTITRAGTVLEIYVNGVKCTKTADANVGTIASNDLHFELGRYPGVAYYDGLADELAIWRGITLTQTQITTLYNGGSGLAYTNFTT